MSTSVSTEPLAATVWFDDLRFWVRLQDGRELGTPLGFYPRLMHATSVQRANWEIIGEGEGIHWPEIDEDISVEGLLQSGGDSTRLGREHHAACELCRSNAGLV